MIRMVYKYYDDMMRTMQFTYYKKLKCYIRVENDLLFFMGVKGNPNAVKKNFMRIFYGIVSIYYGNLSWMGLENAQAPATTIKKSRILSYPYWKADVDIVLSNLMSLWKNDIAPELLEVKNLKEYIDFQKDKNLGIFTFCDRFLNNDALALIMADDHSDYSDELSERLAYYEAKIDSGEYGKSYTKEENYNALYKGIIEGVVVPRDNVYSSPELLLKARTDAENNKRKNLEILSR